ncbi:peptidoglycan O-acetyltransferase [Peptococcaceae bacterium CEB3]|nr:peptidoglycan O-acetyltransferase [Peptococcaceae bacterium CEB3]
MIPYDSFPFFLWLLIPILPAVVLGLTQASPRTRSLWIMHVSIGMLYLILRPLTYFTQAVVYFAFEFALVRTYLYYRQSERHRNKAYVFYLAVIASLLPLLLVKFVPLLGLNHYVQTLLGNPATTALAGHAQQHAQAAHSVRGFSPSLPASPTPSGYQSFPQVQSPSGVQPLSGVQSLLGIHTLPGTHVVSAAPSNQGQMKPIWNSLLGFLGISYVTFRIVGTVIEIRDGLIKEVNLGDFISFVLFFPTLASGPIDRYRRFLADLRKTLTRQEYTGYMIEGLEYIFRGFLYKFIIAYLINRYALAPLNHAHAFWPTVKYMYAYSAYLFFDFAGYSVFAIGVSRFFGIKSPENFKAPFWAKNIKDFWQRWHISLSMWFRDYIYMRFVLTSAKKKWLTNRYTASAAGYLLLFLLMGIWHGTEWHYIIYGLYMAILMIGFEFLERLNKKKHFWGQGKAWDMLARICTLQLTCFGLLIFSGHLF